jgi:hypothetical protein
LAEVYQKKERKAEELKLKMKELESNYKVDFKSKKYQEMQKNYSKERHTMNNDRDNARNLLRKGKMYAKKAMELNTPDRAIVDQKVSSKFPMVGRNHTRWFFGRFGNQEWNKSVDTENNKKIVQLRYSKGQEYLAYSR